MFGIEMSPAVQYLVAFVIIFALLTVFALVLRRITGGRKKFGAQVSRARQPRLGVVDIFDLDQQRQLVLLRRDHVEHLVMIGGASDVVIEAGILRGHASRQPSATQGAAEASEGADRKGEPTLGRPGQDGAPEGPEPTALPPSPARPDVRPLPAAPPPARPVPEPRPAAAEAAQSVDARTAADRQEPALRPERRFEPRPPTRPEAGPAPAPTPPPPQRPAPVAVPPDQTRQAPAPAPAAAGERGERRLTDMARQLEEALKKPFAAVRPSSPPDVPPAPPPMQQSQPPSPQPQRPVPPAPSRPAPLADPPRTGDRPGAGPAPAPQPPRPEGPAAPSLRPLDLPGLRRPTAPPPPRPPQPPAEAPAPAASRPSSQRVDLPDLNFDLPASTAQPGPAAPARPQPPAQAAPRPEPSQRPAAAAPPAAPEPPPAPPSEPAPAAPPDPFSPEAIEAEFARLLRSPSPKT